MKCLATQGAKLAFRSSAYRRCLRTEMGVSWCLETDCSLLFLERSRLVVFFSHSTKHREHRSAIPKTKDSDPPAFAQEILTVIRDADLPGPSGGLLECFVSETRGRRSTTVPSPISPFGPRRSLRAPGMPIMVTFGSGNGAPVCHLIKGYPAQATRSPSSNSPPASLQ